MAWHRRVVRRMMAVPNLISLSSTSRGDPEHGELTMKAASFMCHLPTRYRVINTSCLAAVRFSIDGHKLTVRRLPIIESILIIIQVIEADGILKEETVTESFDLFPGQRVSFVVSMSLQERKAFILK
jgi:FtsP/CotA-like multicopper oxidase with cupredoxin domain